MALLAIAPQPFPTSLVRWDAMWYNVIRAHGYSFTPNVMSSTGFFPLFPLLWRASHLGPVGISLLNLGIAVGAIGLLRHQLRLRWAVVLLFAAFPSSLFLYLPYTEAMFFLFSGLLLLGLTRGQPSLTGFALFGGALVRATAICYLPALAAVAALAMLAAPATWPQQARRLFLGGLVTGTGLVLVMLYQWFQTGVWFAYTKSQAVWDHHLRVPRLPFISSLDNDGALWIDGLALLFGVGCLLWVGRTGWRMARHQAAAPAPVLLFSATYLAVTMLVTVCNAPIEHGQTSLLSLHRYLFCNPFFLVLLEALVPRRAVGWRPTVLALGAVTAVAALLGMLSLRPFDIEWPTSRIPGLWGPVAGLAYALFMLAYAFLWLQTATKWGRTLVYLSSFGLQLFFLYTYAVGHWVG